MVRLDVFDLSSCVAGGLGYKVVEWLPTCQNNDNMFISRSVEGKDESTLMRD